MSSKVGAWSKANDCWSCGASTKDCVNRCESCKPGPIGASLTERGQSSSKFGTNLALFFLFDIFQKGNAGFSWKMGHSFFMKLILIPHNVTLTKAIEDHVVARIDKLDHLDQRILAARVILEHDHTRVPERQFSCAMRLDVRGPDLFAKDIESDLYAAIDAAKARRNAPEILERRRPGGGDAAKELLDRVK